MRTISFKKITIVANCWNTWEAEENKLLLKQLLMHRFESFSVNQNLKFSNY